MRRRSSVSSAIAANPLESPGGDDVSSRLTVLTSPSGWDRTRLAETHRSVSMYDRVSKSRLPETRAIWGSLEGKTSLPVAVVRHRPHQASNTPRQWRLAILDGQNVGQASRTSRCDESERLVTA